MGIGSVVQKALAGNGSLKKLIQNKYASERVKLPLMQGGNLRASEFGDLCPREEVLVALLQLVRKDPKNADKLMVMLHGSALHWALQNHVLPEIGALIGRWTCLDCALAFGDGTNVPSSLVPRPKECKRCKGRDFLYRELELYNEEYRIGGHPDGFLVIPGLPGVGVFEGKSIMKGWEVKNCPILAHVIQVQIYMWFTGLLWAKIIYWEKGVNGLDAVIEHHVERDDDTIISIKQQINVIWKALAAQKPGDPINYDLLPPPICASPDAPRATKCCVGEPCFKHSLASGTPESETPAAFALPHPF